MFKIVVDKETGPERKRACINCGRRDLCGAGSRCRFDGHYIRYADTWDEWCRHWCKDKRTLGEIGVCDHEKS